jgi:hypothetical protein
LGAYRVGGEEQPARIVANFYQYLALTNEDGLTAQNRLDRFSQYGDVYQTPQYRGICIQFESTDGTRAIPAETFLMSVNDVALRNAEGQKIPGVDPLSLYSRNGTFADSFRIVSPKPTTDDKLLSNQYWLWYSSHTESGFKIQVKIPGIFSVPQYAEDLSKCPTGPLYTSATMLNFVEFNACSEGTSLSCVQSLYTKAGGTPQGTWFPTAIDQPAEVVFKDSKKTIRRSPEEVLEYLREEKAIAVGNSPILAALTAEEKATRMNLASTRLMGGSVVSPCQTVVDAPGGLVIQNLQGTLSAKCLDEIYRQTYDGFAPTTYTGIGERYSGIRKDELALPEIQQEFPYRTCQPTGSWAPIKANGEVNDGAIAEINAAIAAFGGDSVVAARGVFNRVYQDANGATDKTVQQVAIERCYGVKKKEFVSNCQGIAIDEFRICIVKAVPTTYTEVISHNVNTIDLSNVSILSTDLTGRWIGRAIDSKIVLFEYPTSATEKEYIIVVQDPDPRWIKMLKIRLRKVAVALDKTRPPSNENTIQVIQISLNSARHISASTTTFPTTSDAVTLLWNSGTTTEVVLDDNERGYGIKNITLSVRTAETISSFTTRSTDQIIQLVKNNRVLTQRLATGSTLEFNQIDVVPVMYYRDLVFPPTGSQRIRLESFVGQGWFLNVDGTISNQKASTFTLQSSSSFLSPSSLSPSSTVAKIYRLTSAGIRLIRNPANGIGGMIAGQWNIDANSSWVILPALNGASAFVSLQLANYPRVFLTTQVNTDGSYTPLCVEFGQELTEIEKALTCWKLYPSDL